MEFVRALRFGTWLLLLAIVVFVAACGGDDDDVTPEPGADGGDTTTVVETETDTATATVTETETDVVTETDTTEGIPGPPFRSGVATAETQVDAVALLTAVRLGRHEAYDRIVFQFRNGTPGYRVVYVEPPIRESGSGRRVDVPGDAYLQITMEPASGYDSTGQGEETYTGPQRIDAQRRAGTVLIEELVRTGDFEAVLTWVAGLDSQVPFRVQAFDEPARIVVDVRN